MSKKDVIASQGGLDEAEPDSVFDFLYHDSRRIASFLSQFDANGLLTGLTQGETASKSAKRGKKLGIGGESPLLGGAKVEIELAPSEAGSETLERVYDPFWANARQFLDVLTERGMIQPDVKAATFGQFVLAQGSLIVADLNAYREMWKSDIIKRYMLAEAAEQNPQPEPDGNRQQRRAGQKAKEATPPREAEITMELLPYLPHSPQINIIADDYAIWGTLETNHLSAAVSDLMLKHGAKVAGTWSAVGIFDGRPYESGDLLSAAEMIAVGMAGDNISKLPLTLAPHIRLLMGRPLTSYAMTPLLIFREVAAWSVGSHAYVSPIISLVEEIDGRAIRV